MKLFNYNKSAKTDYSQNMLPRNRRGVFFDVLKLHWKTFLLYGLLMLVVSLPFSVLSLNRIFAVNDLQLVLANTANVEEQQIIIYQIDQVKTVYAFLQGASLLLVFLFLAGLTRVIRQYAWEENVFFKTDFAEGFKSNWWQMLLLGLIFAIAYAFSVLSYNWGQEVEDIFQSLAMLAPMCLLLLLLLPIVCFAISCIAVYKNSFGNLFKVSSAVAFAQPFATLLALVCCFSLCALLLIPNTVCMVVFRLVIPIVSPIILLGWMLFSFNQFDKYVNATQFPELVGKGTFPIVPTNEDADDVSNLSDEQTPPAN